MRRRKENHLHLSASLVTVTEQPLLKSLLKESSEFWGNGEFNGSNKK